MSNEQPCAGFPDQCPNIRPVAPALPDHGGGIRCGCADQPVGWITPTQAAELQILEIPTAPPLLTIHDDGTIVFRDGYQPDEAAAVFWEAVRNHRLASEFGRMVDIRTGQGGLRQAAYDAVFAYIRQQPRDFLPTTVVGRNAMIWDAVHAALDAAGVPRQECVQPSNATRKPATPWGGTAADCPRCPRYDSPRLCPGHPAE